MSRDTERGRILANRAAKLESGRRKRKGAAHKPWRTLTRDQWEVAKRLTAGQVTLVTVMAGASERRMRMAVKEMAATPTAKPTQ